jgi:hypothetical protein
LRELLVCHLKVRIDPLILTNFNLPRFRKAVYFLVPILQSIPKDVGLEQINKSKKLAERVDLLQRIFHDSEARACRELLTLAYWMRNAGPLFRVMGCLRTIA